ncbi:MAG: DUF1697 domain-containing protein, partial [Acidobacteria bacterium]|nr:DUF1697 domain-containing protein [Acidobacteriota bacterium]
MPIYICFLRGINVGAHKRMKMEELRLGLEGLGFSAIKSYIQSGNLVFRSALRLSPDHLSRRIEEMIERKFGFSADVV